MQTPHGATGDQLIDTGDGHRLWWSQGGDPRGPTVLVIHGGPGGRTRPEPVAWLQGLPVRWVCWDQRGCGRSEPAGECRHNTLRHLLADIDRLRAHLRLGRLALLAGSWGAVPALEYACLRPQSVRGLFLRSAFLGRRDEIDAYCAAWDRWLGDAGRRLLQLPPGGTAALLRGAAQRPPSGLLLQAWTAFEAAHAAAGGAAGEWPGATAAEIDPQQAAAWAVFAHFMRHACFLPHGAQQRWHRRLSAWRSGPLAFVHGLRDTTCPAANTEWLASAAGAAAEVHLVADAGHRTADPALAPVLREAVRRWALALCAESDPPPGRDHPGGH